MSGGNKFQARLDNQKAQLERNGYSAEVVVRTTPEATDMINFARLWEHILITADRRTRGYMSASKREDYEKTQKAFLASIDNMMQHMKEEVDRHGIDLTTNNFISRVAQRYKLSESKKAKPKPKKKPAAKEAQEDAPVKESAQKPVKEAKAPAAAAEKPAAKEKAASSEKPAEKSANDNDAQVEGL